MDECEPLLQGGQCGGRAGKVQDPHARNLQHPGPSHPGWAVPVDPIKPRLKAPVTKRLTLKSDEPLSNLAFTFDLCRYIPSADEGTRLKRRMAAGRCVVETLVGGLPHNKLCF